ncbi:MAG: DUF4350 domain-containing protein [Thiohalocapsa sp.]
MSGPRVSPLPWLLGALVLSLLVAAWAWFDRNFEKQTRELTTGWSEDAQRNPFLAAERFLQRAGIDAASVPGQSLFRDLPPPGDMLVVNGLDSLNRERRERLRSWLRAGGRLLVEATQILEPEEAPRTDDFLAGFGALLRARTDAEKTEVIAKIDFDDYPEPIEVGFVSKFFLEDADDQAIASATADGLPRLLQYSVGKGTLTVTSDNIFLTNADIANHDHALALALMSLGAGKVWLIYDHVAPGLSALLWRAAPQAIIAATLLVIALLWHLGPELGPRLPTRTRTRRNLVDHLEAAAALMSRHGRNSLQLEATRKRIEQAWLRRHPSLHEMDQNDRAAWMSEQIGGSAEQVQDALYRHHQPGQDFTAQTSVLQRLWSAL